MITLTENAAKKIQELFSNEPEAKGKCLRIFVQKGGCSGYEYGFSFDAKKAGDDEIASGGFSLLIDSASAQFLANSTVDYVEDATSSGFKIENPNVKSSCGCGHSHRFE